MIGFAEVQDSVKCEGSSRRFVIRVLRRDESLLSDHHYLA
jgi:hypothetical protein